MSEISKAIELILQSKNGIAFTGSGISAESGISTYRDSGGLWDRYKEGSSGGMLAVLANHPEDAPEILGGFLKSIKNANPNEGHIAIADMEKMGYIKTVITQNVDNLHREAGNTQVYELHGNLCRLRCLQCGKKDLVNRNEFFEIMMGIFEKQKKFDITRIMNYLPKCSCKGTMRPDVVSFGEEVQYLKEATSASLSCDLMLIIGTSGVVYPAASLPQMAKSNGACLIEINPKVSELTPLCNLFVEGSACIILSELVSILKDKI